MTDLKTSIVIDLHGNLVSQGRKYSNTMRQFSKTGQRHLAGLRNMAAATTRGLERMGNRWTALATGAGGAAALRYVSGLEDRMIRLGIASDRSAEQMDEFKQQIFSQALDKRVLPEQVLAAIEEIVARRGDLDLAVDNMENIAIALQATGAQGMDVGAMIADLDEKFRLKGKDEFLATLDEIARQGKAGSFEMRDMVTQGPRVSAAYASTGRTGRMAAKEMGAILQIVRRSTATADSAATSFERMIATITQDKVKELQDNGIVIWDEDELKKGNKVARSIPAIIKDIIKATNGDSELLGKVFQTQDMRGLLGFVNEFKQTGAIESLDKFLAVQGDGTVLMQDAERAANTASAAMTNLLTVLKQYADSELAEPISDIAKAINAIDPKTLTTMLKVATFTGGGLAAIVAGKKIKNMVLGGKQSDGASGPSIPGVPAGVMPVFVVNDMMRFGNGQLGRAAGKNKVAKGGKLLSKGLMLAGGAVTAAGAAGYGVGTVLDKTVLQGTSFRDELGVAIAAAMARLGSDTAQQAIDADLNTRSQVDVNLKIDQDGRVRVDEMKSSSPAVNASVDMDAGFMMAGP